MTGVVRLHGGQADERTTAQFPPSSSRRAITCAWISAAPSKMLRMRASQRIREIGYSSAKPLPPWIWSALSADDPGDARGEELRHAGLDVAPFPGVLRARGEVGELARGQHLGRHDRELVADARERREAASRTGPARSRSASPDRARRLRDADRARGGLDARGLEGLHQLLEALPLDPAEEVSPPAPRSRRRRVRIPSCPGSRAPRSRRPSGPRPGTDRRPCRAASARGGSRGPGSPARARCGRASSSGRRGRGA